MNRGQRLRAVFALRRHWAAVLWAVSGIAIWVFLAMPYAVSASECLDAGGIDSTYQCLKPVAKKLRADSNIATYATATVAAIIAMQLANRNRREAVGDDDGGD